MSVLFEQGNVTVEPTRYIVGERTYAINSIVSVEMNRYTHPKRHDGYRWTDEIPEKNGWAKVIGFMITALSISLFTYFYFNITATGFFDLIGTGIILFCAAVVIGIEYQLTFGLDSSTNGLGAAILGIWFPYQATVYSKKRDVYKSVPDTYAVVLATAGGSVSSYESHSKDMVQNIVAAINKAIIQRG